MACCNWSSNRITTTTSTASSAPPIRSKAPPASLNAISSRPSRTRRKMSSTDCAMGKSRFPANSPACCCAAATISAASWTCWRRVRLSHQPRSVRPAIPCWKNSPPTWSHRNPVPAAWWKPSRKWKPQVVASSTPTAGTFPYVLARTCCAAAWIPSPSCAISPRWARSWHWKPFRMRCQPLTRWTRRPATSASKSVCRPAPPKPTLNASSISAVTIANYVFCRPTANSPNT